MNEYESLSNEEKERLEAARDPLKEIAEIKKISVENAITLVAVDHAAEYLTTLKKAVDTDE